MPDVLDDVEGFFGLEEVDGVDVVVTAGGKVEYKVGLLLSTARNLSDNCDSSRTPPT